MQMSWRIASSLALLLCACNSSAGDETGTEGASGGGGSSTTATTTTSETETASDTVESVSDTNSGTDSTSSSGAADASTSDSSNTEGSSSTGGGSSSTGDEGSSSTGDGRGSDLYGPCAGELNCAAAFDCEEVDLGPITGLNWCTQPCDVAANDCPAAEDGTADAVCRAGAEPGDPGVCQLNCDEETSCPDGMECYVADGANEGFCAFSADFVP